VIGAVVVDVLVPDLLSGPHDERRTELRDALAGTVDPVPGGPCPFRAGPAA
jgi:hypothetical protein